MTTIATTTLSDGLITDFDPDYPATPHSWFRLQPAGTLPEITDSLVIDGYTQPGASPNTNPEGGAWG